MEFAFDDRTQELRERLLGFMNQHVYPAEPVFGEQAERSPRLVLLAEEIEASVAGITHAGVSLCRREKPFQT